MFAFGHDGWHDEWSYAQGHPHNGWLPTGNEHPIDSSSLSVLGDLSGSSSPSPGHANPDHSSSALVLEDLSSASPLPSGHGHLAHPFSASVLGDLSASGQRQGSTASSSALMSSSSLAPTLVGSTGGLQIDLQWDSSVANAPSWFRNAVDQAATKLIQPLSTPSHEVINTHVGWGEVGGSSLPPNEPGQSESYGYVTDYTTVAEKLNAVNPGLIPSSLENAPTTSQLFVTAADAKTLGLVSPTSTSVDGNVGFGTLSHTGYSWDFNSSTPTKSQFDFQAVVQHELSEAMGRFGMEGQLINGKPTYTPLDLLNYSRPNTLGLSANGGYFSVNGGGDNLGNFTAASGSGGDVGDWATNSNTRPSSGDYDAFDAFATPGLLGQVTSHDTTEMLALGYGKVPTA
jgi:hypothetical protein